MPYQEPILFTFEPSLPAWEPDGACFFANLVINMIDIAHVPLQLYRLFSYQP